MDPKPSAVCPECEHVDPDGELGKRCPNDGTPMVCAADHKASPDDPFLGRVVGGKYPVIGRIGAGTQGAVYRALQEPVGREVALKVIKPGGYTDRVAENLRARFVREAKIVAQLSHPSTVTLHDYGVEEDGTLYMVLELVRGKLLSRTLAEEGRMSAGRAVAIVYQVLQSLAEAHALGLVHRDLKPANVMLVRGPFGEELVKVLDFGIARAPEGQAGDFRTQIGTLLGTPRYMAPEQARGSTAEPRSDLYSVGVMLFELLSGKVPFGGDDPMLALMAHLKSPVPPLAPELQVPAALEAAVRKALAKTPDERFPDAQAMAQALMEARGAEAGSARAPGHLVAPRATPAELLSLKETLILADRPKPKAQEPAPAAAPIPLVVTAAERAPTAAPGLPLSPAPEADEADEADDPGAADADLEAAFGPRRRLAPLLVAGALVGGLALAVGGYLLTRAPAATGAPDLDISLLEAPPEAAATIEIPPAIEEPEIAEPARPEPKEEARPAAPPEPEPVAARPAPKPKPAPKPAPVRRAYGFLSVECDIDCGVYVDGVAKPGGKRIALEPGTHLLWVRDRESGNSQRREIEITSGKTLKQTFEF